MSNHETLRAALLTVFRTDEQAEPEIVADAIAAMMCAFGAVIRGPAPEVVAAELVADDTPRLILAEIRELICEIRADRQERAKAMHDLFRHAVDTMRAADTSGLPG